MFFGYWLETGNSRSIVVLIAFPLVTYRMEAIALN
jgi:hypothetical protein